MYSVVLMTALVTSTAAPNWHRCHGCYVGYAGYAGYAGYSGYAGYAGYGGYSGYGCHGCHGYGAAGGCYGYHGGCYGAFGIVYADSHYGGCTGCYGCYGGYSCYGVPVPIVPAPAPKFDKDLFPPINPKKDDKGAEEVAPPKEKKKEEEKKDKAMSKENQQPRAKIRIEVPEGGKLFVDGRQIDVAAGTRVFQTPPLALGQAYMYDIRIEVEQNGATRRDEQRVIIQPGTDALVSFPSLSPPVAYSAQVPR
jgi:uncharacterized protein (TIGR03000 family)